jgi:predicted glutamine amidotransferase
MCIIIDNSQGKKLEEYIISNSIDFNPDGFAFYNLKTGDLIKTMDKKKIRDLLSLEVPFLCHCRKATKGAICEENIHFFESGDWIFAMNGTVLGFSDPKANDTRLIFKIILEHVKQDKILDFLNMWEARFLLYNRKSKKLYKTGIWHNKDGVFYSKQNVLEEKVVTYYNNYNNFNNRTYDTVGNSFKARPEYIGNYYKYDNAKDDWQKNKIEKESLYFLIGALKYNKKKFQEYLKEEANFQFKARTLCSYVKTDLEIPSITSDIDLKGHPISGHVFKIRESFLEELIEKHSLSVKEIYVLNNSNSKSFKVKTLVKND